MTAVIHVGPMGVGYVALAFIAAVVILIGIVWYASRHRGRTPEQRF